MNKTFLDTGYLLALELARDQNHESAKQHWDSLARPFPPFITTSYVFDEVVTYFNSRGHHAKAVQLGNNLLLSSSIELIHVDEALFYAGWELFQQHQDKDYSLTDCISFIVMKRWGVDLAFSFDGHFTQAGFARAP